MGLSPRVRGNPRSPGRGLGPARSIPACAGEPHPGPLPRHALPVYPRVCGGTVSGLVFQADCGGLSPRVRGNPRPVRRGVVNRGSIPACAGEPPGSAWVFGLFPVYPRVCGGTRSANGIHRHSQGLSPRVRGNPAHGHVERPQDRSIPACAGEPHSARRNESPDRVYPRVCGGTCLMLWRLCVLRGLSPRVRGNHRLLCTVCPWPRSIPACAGEPRCAGLDCDRTRVYPRVCGGTGRRPTLFAVELGLSPRVRGNLAAELFSQNPHRSIPACAGEPAAGAGCGVAGEVYPRVCGGTPASRKMDTLTMGLSPRVRGNQGAVAAASVRCRSIPACAGEPECCIRG